MAIELDDLAVRLVRLEPAAFDEFALAFGPRLRRLFASWGANPADAEALAVSSISDIALKADRFVFQGTGSFAGWVFTLARRAWIDFCRRRSPAHSLDGFDPPEPELPSEDPPSGLDEEVSQGLAQLSDIDQAILRARYLGPEQSFAEIAQTLGLEEGAARVRHLRALRRLERILDSSPAVRDWLERRRPRDRPHGEDHA
jgi:RNA polymerase sigma factor (sigma-70 family)